MLRTGKTFSLLLLFSFPIVAMELTTTDADRELPFAGPLTEEQSSEDLTRTVSLTKALLEEKLKLSEINKEKEALAVQEAKATETLNSTLKQLLAKRDEKELERKGNSTLLESIKQQLAKLEEEKEQRTAVVASETAARASQLNADLEKAKAQEDAYQEEIKRLNALIEPAPKTEESASAQKTKKWYLFWLA